MSELDQYDYDLPRELVAQQPLIRRTDARLLVADRNSMTISHSHIRHITEWLSPGDCLVLNDTRVVPARLLGHRTQTGGKWEGLFLRVDEEGHWRILCKTRGKLTPGETVSLLGEASDDDLRLRLIEKLPDGQWIVHPESDEETFDLLARVGRVPLPQYIRGGEMVADDVQRYQTVFARQDGAVAAPTAGLHFTRELLQKAELSGISTCFVTLHVGLDTFRPVKVDSLADHTMHSEWGSINEATVEHLTRCRAEGGRIVAVGTTSVRVLETASSGGVLRPWSGPTDLFIRPPYKFQAVDALMTNFHLPRTTLLVLVRTFGGDALIRQAYEQAIAEEYRFYSYGDTMLIR